MKLYAPSTISSIRKKHGFGPTKSLGQNFLTDKNIIDKIVDGAKLTGDDMVIEIGPGLGVLTWEMAQKAKKVVAVELDKKLIPILEENLTPFNNIEILNQDILKTDVNSIIRDWPREKVKIVGNLPYYITTPIIFYLLEKDVMADSIVIMMQKEVADRIKSEPNCKEYGPLSVAVQYYCDVEEVATVPKEVFYPIPKVDSAVLRLKIRENPKVKVNNKDDFFKVVKASFSQRRKTLANSLGSLGMAKTEIMEMLEEAKIDSKRRAETLSLEEFANLANCYGKA